MSSLSALPASLFSFSSAGGHHLHFECQKSRTWRISSKRIWIEWFVCHSEYCHHVVTIALSPLIELSDEESIDFSAPRIDTAKWGRGKLHSKVDIGFLHLNFGEITAIDESVKPEGNGMNWHRKIHTSRRLLIQQSQCRASFQEEILNFKNVWFWIFSYV